ncbi:MAG: tetratricopeptide repeat protein [bacterium]
MGMARIVITCVVLFGASIPSYALSENEQLQFADGLYTRGMWETALKEYQAYLGQNPGKPSNDAVSYRMGECYRSLGRTNEADQTYQRIFEDFPGGEFHYRAGLRRAELLEQDGKKEEQAQLLGTMLKGAPPPEMGAACQFALGVALEKRGKLEEAAVAYDAVLSKYPGTQLISYAALSLAGLDRRGDGKRAAVLYGLAAAAPGSPRVGAEALFQLGDFCFSRKEYDPAAQAYEKLATQYPGDERVGQSRLQQAWSLYNAKRYADALKVCGEVRAGGTAELGKAQEWLYLKANCQRQVMKNEDAVVTYGELLKNYPQGDMAASAAYERALALYKLGRFQEAIEQARGLMVVDRIKRDVVWLLAESSAAVHDEAGAVQYYRLMVDQYPDSALAGDALYRLAHLLQKKGDWLQAAELFGRLTDDFPKHELAPQAMFAQASCLGTAQKPEQAVAAYARLLEKFPQSRFVEDALYQKAISETYLRRDAHALETWQELLLKFPATKYMADARFWNGVLLEESGKLEESEIAFRRALMATPPPSEDLQQRVRFRLALVLQRRGKSDEAAPLLQGLIASPMRDKFPAELLEWLGDYQLGKREFAKASEVVDLLIAQAKSDNWKQTAWCLKGKALMGQGKNDEARQAFERVTGLNFPGQAMAEAWLKLGELNLLSGDADKAKRAFEESATMAGTDLLLPIRVQAYAGIGKALKAQGDHAGAARHFLSVAVLFDDPVLVPECLYEASLEFAAANRADDAGKARKELAERYPDSEWAKKK